MEPAVRVAKRILLVEDDRFQRRAAESMLQQRGFEVSAVGDGEEALRVVKKGPPPDLVLLDLIMPQLSGFEVLRRLKADARTRDIPVLVLSNLAQEADVRRALDAGAAEYLVKAKVSLRELIARIETRLGGGGGP